MKRKMTFIATCLGAWLALSSFGQWTAGHEYRPFLREGKTWLVQYNEESVEAFHFPNDSCLFYLQGDTIIDGTIYMKAYRQFLGEAPAYYAALREADRKVYMIHHLDYDGNPETRDEYTLYDFDCKRSDYFTCFTGSNGPSLGCGVITTTGIVMLRENTFFYQQFREVMIVTPIMNYYIVYECIGNLNEPFTTLSGHSSLLSCYEGETCLYEKGDEIKYLEGIHSIKHEELKMNNEMFDLQGRRVAHPKQGEVYIQKGKKYINK